MENGLKL